MSNQEIKVTSKRYWNNWFSKFFSFFVSVKVVGLIAVMSVSTFLLINGFIDGSTWGKVIIANFPVVLTFREILKIENIGKILKKKEEED